MADSIDSSNTPLTFPCHYPIKVMGREHADFRSEVLGIIQAHVAPIEDDDVTTKSSSKGKYVSLTVMVHAASRDQLDRIYRELHASDSVMQTL